MYLEDESHSYHISSLMDRKMKGEKFVLILKRLKEEIVLLIIQKGVVKHILWLVCNSRR